MGLLGYMKGKVVLERAFGHARAVMKVAGAI
jgi:hypothetical protein